MPVHDATPAPFRYAPPPGLPTVLHEDDHVVVVDKPSGLLSVPGRGDAHHDSALVRLQNVMGPLWVVHRLDMDTSGVIVYARHRQAAAALGRAFEQRMAHKRYVAWVSGILAQAHGEIDLPLRLDWPHRPRQVVDPEQGKPSVTRWCVLGTVGGNTRVQLEPLTGRSHQLRVHMAAMGHAILGDRFYGPGADLPQDPNAPRLMLHAQRLELPHPEDGRPVSYEAEAPF